MRRFFAALAVLWFTAGLVACSDETTESIEESAREAREDAENAAGATAARVVAEELRAALKLKDLGEGLTERHVSVLNEVVNDLPGDPEITGIDDGDGDGKDDDGKVEAHVDDQSACLTISEDGKDTNIENGPC